MKILVCSSALSYQMDASYSTRMRANAMVRAGLSVTVVGLPQGYPNEGHEILFEYVSAQTAWSPVKIRWFRRIKKLFGNYGTFLIEPWYVIKTAYEMARERGFDLIYHTHLEPCVMWPLVFLLKMRRLWRPTVGMMPGLFYYPYTAKTYPLVARTRGWLNDYFARRLTAHMPVCCNSKYVIEIMQEQDNRNMVVVPEGYEKRAAIPEQSAARSRLGLPAGERMLLLLGVSSKTKGTDLLLKTLESIPPSFLICIVGKTGGVYEKSWGDFRALNEKGWAEKLRVISDFVPDAVMEDYYAACDAVIIPYRKGFPTTSTHMRMAAEFGKAIIACDQYLIGETVRQYQLGLLFAPEDVEGLRNCLVEFAAKPREWYDKIRQNASCLVEDFNWDKMGVQYRQLFEDILASHGKIMPSDPRKRNA